MAVLRIPHLMLLALVFKTLRGSFGAFAAHDVDAALGRRSRAAAPCGRLPGARV